LPMPSFEIFFNFLDWLSLMVFNPLPLTQKTKQKRTVFGVPQDSNRNSCMNSP